MKMAELEGDIARLEEQLRNIDKVSNLNEVIDELKEKAAQLSKQISAHIKQQDNAIYAEIKKVFNNVFRTVFDVPALLYVQPNAQGNIDFKSEVSDADENKITAQSNGNTYHKMLCVAFDLAVLIAYNKKSFYRFVYHDGVLEGLDNRKSIYLLSSLDNIANSIIYNISLQLSKMIYPLIYLKVLQKERNVLH